MFEDYFKTGYKNLNNQAYKAIFSHKLLVIYKHG